MAFFSKFVLNKICEVVAHLYHLEISSACGVDMCVNARLCVCFNQIIILTLTLELGSSSDVLVFVKLISGSDSYCDYYSFKEFIYFKTRFS